MSKQIGKSTLPAVLDVVLCGGGTHTAQMLVTKKNVWIWQWQWCVSRYASVCRRLRGVYEAHSARTRSHCIHSLEISLAPHDGVAVTRKQKISECRSHSNAWHLGWVFVWAPESANKPTISIHTAQQAYTAAATVGKLMNKKNRRMCNAHGNGTVTDCRTNPFFFRIFSRANNRKWTLAWDSEVNAEPNRKHSCVVDCHLHLFVGVI